jgi:hypothetical protein
MLESTVELIKAIFEMYEVKAENDQIYHTLGRSRERLIHKSDIITPTNHADRSYTMFDPTTRSNVTQLKSSRTLKGLTIGGYYVPIYDPPQEQFLRTKHPEYRKLVGSFSNYYQNNKKYFGNKSLILDEKRFEFLYSNFQQAKSMNPHLNLDSKKLWDLYNISFDAN